MMELCWVTLPVRDVEASMAFYCGLLGLPVDSRHSGHGMDMVMLGAANQAKVELLHMDADPARRTNPISPWASPWQILKNF